MMRLPVWNRRSTFVWAASACAWTFVPGAAAQEVPEPAGGDLPTYAQVFGPQNDRDSAESAVATTNGLPNIMLTGYWPPTNEMLRQFSPDPIQNPGGWVGQNWEGRGYNLYAFFPEFPGGLGQGVGDFEVDYQDTSADWWLLTDQIKPRSIITFSRANTTRGWELEGGNRNYALADWTDDYESPFDPTPELPIANEPVGNEYFSSLPMQDIVNAVIASGANVNPFTTVIDNGRFLSNYIGYHGNWYHELHADPADSDWNIAAGHIHVGRFTDLPDAVLATEVTLRTLIAYLDTQSITPGDFDEDGDVDLGDYATLSLCLNGPAVTTPPAGCSAQDFASADLDRDRDVDLHDYNTFAGFFTG